VPLPPPDAEPERAAPTLDDVAGLTRESDYSRFVAADVDPAVRNAALKKLFTDPHFNVMDGLDVYIDDYARPDPLPASMLRKMVQSAALGLFESRGEGTAEDGRAPPTEPSLPAQAALTDETIERDDQDPSVRLQPDDAAGPTGAAGGAGEDGGSERGRGR
jgi:hypothetical protein